MEGEERQALIWERVVRRQYTVNGRCHGCAARNTDGPPVCHSAIRHSTISIFNTLSTRYRLIIWQYRPIINYPPLYFITAERRREILLWPASDRPDSVVGLYGTQLHAAVSLGEVRSSRYSSCQELPSTDMCSVFMSLPQSNASSAWRKLEQCEHKIHEEQTSFWWMLFEEQMHTDSA